MPDHYKRYLHEDQFAPSQYVQYAQDKLSKLPVYDQTEIKRIKTVLVKKVDKMGETMADELLLKLGSFLNGADNGK